MFGKNRNFKDSLKCAVSGFVSAVLTERNLRFDIAAASLAAVFGYAYGLDLAGWAVLVLICVSVISAELFNTALENAVDTATEKYSKTAKAAKDISAAAVLVRAAGAVLAGILLFSDTERVFCAFLNLIFSKTALYITIFIIMADIAFILFCKKK